MIQLLITLFVYFVSFTDKPEKTAPQLSPRAIEQRRKWNIPTDEMDYPVSGMYLSQLRAKGIKVYHVSRWFNGATVEMDEETAASLKKLNFVKSVEMTRDDSEHDAYLSRRKISAVTNITSEDMQAMAMQSDKQLALYNLLPLHEAGFHGQGILITMCDGGFMDVDKLSCFRQKQELGHFDFTDDGDDFYGESGAHGLYCLSLVSGKTDEYTGAATEADYYLMRSEESEPESPKEMDNLVAALEKADSLGTNVFSVSLGYSLFDNEEWTLDYDMLNGKTTRASRAATIAARKGMLVCVSAGNDGNKPWHYISSPADADSVLTVGAVTTDSVIGDFSSFGPSADGRIKPEVCAVGVRAAVLGVNGQVTHGNGTSFAAPLMAGLAATLWSALPDENAMQIRERIIRSADRYGNPDRDQYGYGIPDAYAAYLGRTATMNETPVSKRSVKYIQGNNLYIDCNSKTYDILGRTR